MSFNLLIDNFSSKYLCSNQQFLEDVTYYLIYRSNVRGWRKVFFQFQVIFQFLYNRQLIHYDFLINTLQLDGLSLWHSRKSTRDIQEILCRLNNQLLSLEDITLENRWTISLKCPVSINQHKIKCQLGFTTFICFI